MGNQIAQGSAKQIELVVGLKKSHILIKSKQEVQKFYIFGQLESQGEDILNKLKLQYC